MRFRACTVASIMAVANVEPPGTHSGARVLGRWLNMRNAKPVGIRFNAHPMHWPCRPHTTLSLATNAPAHPTLGAGASTSAPRPHPRFMSQNHRLLSVPAAANRSPSGETCIRRPARAPPPACLATPAQALLAPLNGLSSAHRVLATSPPLGRVSTATIDATRCSLTRPEPAASKSSTFVS